ncbi:MAG: DUF4232 domain-containing protein [Streptomyces sp.]
MRTNRIRAAVLAGSTAALALSLIACGGSDDSGDNASKGGASRTVATADGSKSSEGTVTETTDGPGKNGGADNAKQTKPCKGDEMSYSVVHRFPSEQGEHLLVTATNADSTSCWITSMPSVMLGNTSKVVPHSAKDAPGGSSQITVEPGGKVYSAIALFTVGGRTHSSTDLSVALSDRTGYTGPGTETSALDGKGAQSEFTWSDAEVTNWNTEKPYNF